MDLTKFIAGNKFGLLIDLRSMADTTLHGNGRRLVNTTDGVHLIIERTTSGSGNLHCHIYIISDSQMNIIGSVLGNNNNNKMVRIIITIRYAYMDPRKIPFNVPFVDPTNSGKTQYILSQLRGPFRGKFDYIVLICPTFVFNKTYDYFVDNEPRIFVINCQQHEVEAFLSVVSFHFEKTNTLIILDDCAASKDVKSRTSQLAALGFSASHSGLSV